MILKNQAGQGVYLFAWDSTNSVPKTGDAANITGTQSLDGATPGTAFATAHPTEIGGGVYWQPLAQAETNGSAVAYRWASTTAGIQIDPILGLTSRTELAASGLDAVTIETGINARQAQAIQLAALAGVLLGAGTGTITIKNPDGSATRITATTDASGDRTVIVLNLPA